MKTSGIGHLASLNVALKALSNHETPTMNCSFGKTMKNPLNALDGYRLLA